jgi:hypothetical protein
LDSLAQALDIVKLPEVEIKNKPKKKEVKESKEKLDNNW